MNTSRKIWTCWGATILLAALATSTLIPSANGDTMPPAKPTVTTPAPTKTPAPVTPPAANPAPAATPATNPAPAATPAPATTPAATPAKADKRTAEEILTDKLELEQLQMQVESAKLSLQRSKLELAAAERAAAEANATDIANGVYMFCEGVDTSTVKAAIADLNKLSRRNPKKPLTIIINSPGGSVISGLALYDHIRELSGRGHHITVKVRGMAASMGGILLQAGDTRVIGADSLVLIHEVSGGTSGRVNDMLDDVRFSQRLWEKLSEILAKRSKMNATQIRDKAHKFDWWLDANEAKALGFADKIE